MRRPIIKIFREIIKSTKKKRQKQVVGKREKKYRLTQKKERKKKDGRMNSLVIWGCIIIMAKGQRKQQKRKMYISCERTFGEFSHHARLSDLLQNYPPPPPLRR